MSMTLHAEALAWLRFAKRMPVVCTEGGFHADVLGMNTASVIEVEVKSSASDMRAEFKNKKLKHSLYRWAADGSARPSTYVPNYWWMLVDKVLEQKALDLLATEAPYGGVLVREQPTESPYAAGRWNLRIARKAKKIHGQPPRPLFVRSAILRMANEVVGWNLMAGARFEGAAPEKISEAVSTRMAGVEGVLDFEDVDADLERRGAELAWVMGKDWQKIDSVAKAQWCLRAQQLLMLRRGPIVVEDLHATI